MDRVKSAKEFGVGVEVSQTGNRGYGLRALRSFEPGQIIVEYSGEIITQEESERRLDEVYNNNKVNSPANVLCDHRFTNMSQELLFDVV